MQSNISIRIHVDVYSHEATGLTGAVKDVETLGNRKGAQMSKSADSSLFSQQNATKFYEIRV